MKSVIAKIKKGIHQFILVIIMSSLMIITWQSSAAEFSIVIKATIIDKTCDINGGVVDQPINVIFDDIVINSINGKDYRRTPIIYNIDCKDEDDDAKPPLRLKFGGTGASFDSSILRVNEEDNLGLLIQANGSQMKINEWFEFNYGSEPKLYVVPVANKLGGIRGGDFTASGTLSVEYL
ncbi:fimbrial protein [Providencia manganoxydans]|uniref:fimbrial protein n=1 Tax=Providencia manganoxydans TaxID=2923283 RepID=UPI0034DD62B4